MALDPALRAALDEASTEAPADPNDIVAIRLAAERRHGRRSRGRSNSSDLAVEERILDVGERRQRVLVVQPAGIEGPLPTVVHFHGGSWILGSPEQSRPITDPLARLLPAVVVSVAYRLAPEHRFPQGFEDAAAALAYVIARPEEFGGGDVLIAGDSAGGNFCAGLSLRAREQGWPLAAALLLYPSSDLSRRFPSMDDYGSGYGLETPVRDDSDALYLRGDADRLDLRASPLRATSFAGLPPTYVNTAEYDPLKDHGAAWADALRLNGGAVALRESPGMIHGYPSFSESAAAVDEYARVVADFRAFVATSAGAGDDRDG